MPKEKKEKRERKPKAAEPGGAAAGISSEAMRIALEVMAASRPAAVASPATAATASPAAAAAAAVPMARVVVAPPPPAVGMAAGPHMNGGMGSGRLPAVVIASPPYGAGAGYYDGDYEGGGSSDGEFVSGSEFDEGEEGRRGPEGGDAEQTATGTVTGVTPSGVGGSEVQSPQQQAGKRKRKLPAWLMDGGDLDLELGAESPATLGNTGKSKGPKLTPAEREALKQAREELKQAREAAKAERQAEKEARAAAKADRTAEKARRAEEKARKAEERETAKKEKEESKVDKVGFRNTRVFRVLRCSSRWGLGCFFLLFWGRGGGSVAGSWWWSFSSVRRLGGGWAYAGTVTKHLVLWLGESQESLCEPAASHPAPIPRSPHRHHHTPCRAVPTHPQFLKCGGSLHFLPPPYTHNTKASPSLSCSRCSRVSKPTPHPHFSCPKVWELK